MRMRILGPTGILSGARLLWGGVQQQVGPEEHLRLVGNHTRGSGQQRERACMPPSVTRSGTAHPSPLSLPLCPPSFLSISSPSLSPFMSISPFPKSTVCKQSSSTASTESAADAFLCLPPSRAGAKKSGAAQVTGIKRGGLRESGPHHRLDCHVQVFFGAGGRCWGTRISSSMAEGARGSGRRLYEVKCLAISFCASVAEACPCMKLSCYFYFGVLLLAPSTPKALLS